MKINILVIAIFLFILVQKKEVNLINRSTSFAAVSLPVANKNLVGTYMFCYAFKVRMIINDKSEGDQDGICQESPMRSLRARV